MKIVPLLTVLICLSLAAPVTAPAAAAGLSSANGAFKVVKPPAPGAKRFAVEATTKKRKPPRQRHKWFWQIASPKLSAANPSRYRELATQAAERLQSDKATALVRGIQDTYYDEIEAATRPVNISPALLAAVIATESAGKVRARSHAGAQGLAQLMPGTARRFGVRNSYDAAENLRGAAEYLAFLLEMFDGDVLLALAGYNAGENAVLRYKGVPPFNETRDYIPKVLNYYAATFKVECLFDPKVTGRPCVPLILPD